MQMASRILNDYDYFVRLVDSRTCILIPTGLYVWNSVFLILSSFTMSILHDSYTIELLS